MGREDEIRLIAYNIWEQEGCLNEHDCEHWYRAEAIWEQQREQTSAATGAEKQPGITAEQKTKSKVPKKRSKKT
jgi:hypothetical protein